jgi:hypothetical protein
VTDDELFTAFTDMEKRGNAKKEGADYPAIYRDLAKQSGRKLTDVIKTIIDRTLCGPN